MSIFRVYVDGQIFYHPHLSKLAITEATVSEDAENIDSFTLSAPYNHPYIDFIRPMASVIQCRRDSLTYNADSGAAASGSDPSGRGAFVRRTASGGATSTWKTGNQSASHTHSISASNASNSHNNIQPYVTCYMWKRTA